jgi:hypothetical protein
MGSDTLEVVLAVAVGISLSACAGLRAFLPLLATGLLARTGHYTVNTQLEWLSSTPALVALGVAALVELLADKIPALDHLLDVAQTPVRTVAGVIVAAAAFAPFPHWAALLLGIVVGGTTALSVHATKATVRAGSTATTAGAANPVLSLIEDFLCAAGSFLAPVLAVVALVLSVVAVASMFVVGRAAWRRLRRSPAA